MTKEEFTAKLEDLLEEGIEADGMRRDELIGIVSYRLFALQLSYAETVRERAKGTHE